MAISIYCALVASNFKHGVILAVSHDGDSDSTWSTVGNPLGAMHGVKVIPAEWLEPLDISDQVRFQPFERAYGSGQCCKSVAKTPATKQKARTRRAK